MEWKMELEIRESEWGRKVFMRDSERERKKCVVLAPTLAHF